MAKIYLSSKGVKPTIDNSKIINHQIEIAKDRDTIVFPNGAYPVEGIRQVNKGLRWEGQEDTTILCTQNAPVAEFNTNNGWLTTEIDRIIFRNIYNWDLCTNSGLKVHQVVKITDCEIHNFGGIGIEMTADIDTHGAGSNVSFSRLENLLIAQCKKGGIYFQGGDSNQSLIQHCDVRDTPGPGFWDASFLGNKWINCMAHACWRSYVATDLGNRADFIGCYAEHDCGQSLKDEDLRIGDSPRYKGLHFEPDAIVSNVIARSQPNEKGDSLLLGSAQWFGGFPSNGIEHGPGALINCSQLKSIQ